VNGWQPHLRVANTRNRKGSNEGIHPFKRRGQKGVHGMVKVSEFEQKLGHTRIHHAVIVQHAGYWPEIENQPNST
jgi:hypothetical protein